MPRAVLQGVGMGQGAVLLSPAAARLGNCPALMDALLLAGEGADCSSSGNLGLKGRAPAGSAPVASRGLGCSRQQC